MNIFKKEVVLLDWVLFGIKIKTARLKKGLTQQDLAEIVDVTPVSISYYESGKKKPSFEKIKTICTELGISIEEI